MQTELSSALYELGAKQEQIDRFQNMWMLERTEKRDWMLATLNALTSQETCQPETERMIRRIYHELKSFGSAG